jgi:spore coat protein U-like protein
MMACRTSVRSCLVRPVLAIFFSLGAAAAQAVHTCNVSVGNMSFGAFTGSQISSSSTLSVSCTITSGIIDNVNFTATLSTGAGTYAQRLLTHVGSPPDTLPYNLYVNTVPGVLNTSVWGDGNSGTVVGSGSMQLIIIFNPTRTVSITVAGAMGPVAAMPTAGTYSDTVAATITYN